MPGPQKSSFSFRFPGFFLVLSIQSLVEWKFHRWIITSMLSCKLYVTIGTLYLINLISGKTTQEFIFDFLFKT